MTLINEDEIIMNKIIFLLAVIMLISCNEKIKDKKVNRIETNDSKTAPYNLTDLGDGKKYNYDTLSVAYIKKVQESLLKREFKFPSQEKFKEKISEVFNIKIYDYKNSIVVLRPAMFTEIAIKEHRFILIEDPETDSDPNNINEDLEYYYNSYVFYGDKKAFNWLKINNEDILKDLGVEYDYVINDSDGFTNLRKDKSSRSVIIEKIKSGEKVEILDDSGNWRLIKTNSGNTGYVYKTKLQAVN